MTFRLLALGLLLALAGLSVPLGAQDAPPEAASRTERLVAIGDVHGDLETFCRLLARLELVDEELRWRGADARCVQLGDLIDRGARGREVLELAMRLEVEAAAAGGAFVVLLGNHEVMNLMGDLRYVPAEEYAAFAGEEDPAMRASARERILSLVTSSHPLLRSRYFAERRAELNARTFDEFFPPGFFAHRAAFRPDGRYGKWLLSRLVVHRHADTLFAHAGVDPAVGFAPLETINSRAHVELRSFFRGVEELERLGVFHAALDLSILEDLIAAERKAGMAAALERPVALIEKALEGTLLHEKGPIWSRTLARDAERPLYRAFVSLLEYHAVRHMVVGHTVTRSRRIETRFGHRLILVDTGMNQRFYGGTPSALELPPGKPPRMLEAAR